MEGNICDEDVNVPPRKRLLAGFKKQNGSSGTKFALRSPNGIEADSCVENVMRSDLSPNSSFSLEEIVERSDEAALAAAKVSEAARIVAEEKAVIAGRAIAAAKTALDLVAEFDEENTGRYSCAKKNKSKRGVTVHSPCKKRDEVENDVTDGEELSQVIYRTHGLSKHSPPSSDLKHKRPKILPEIEKTRLPNEGIFDRDSRALFSDSTLDTEGSRHEVSPFENDGDSSLTKLINSSLRMDKKHIVTQRRRPRKQLM